MDYRELVRFKFDNHNYVMYLDDFNKHFFLKINNRGEYEYLTIEELIDISYHFATIPNVMNVENNNYENNFQNPETLDYENINNQNTQFTRKKKKHILPKVIVGGTAILLVGTVSISYMIDLYTRKKYHELDNQTPSIITTIDDYISKYPSIKLGTKEYTSDSYISSDISNYKYVYDMDYLNQVIDCKDVTKEDMLEILNNNNNISQKFKSLIAEYVELLYDKYPDANKNVLYENLKTLKVNEIDNQEMIIQTCSTASCGCYIKSRNEIYVLNDCNFVPGTWDYQVIMHELSHCLRTKNWKDENGNECLVSFEGEYKNTPISEALNSLFAISLFNYEEKDIAYQFQSNMVKIMLECMDNYTLTDYVNHSLYYFAEKLDELNNDDDYATVILDLMRIQYDDYHSEKVDIPQSEYYRIYDYISKMYYNKYITNDMSFEEATQVTNKLLDDMLFDVPEEYNVDKNHFYEYLKEYCAERGINESQSFVK